MKIVQFSIPSCLRAFPERPEFFFFFFLFSVKDYRWIRRMNEITTTTTQSSSFVMVIFSLFFKNNN
jgi:hypothetical protein